MERPINPELVSINALALYEAVVDHPEDDFSHRMEAFRDTYGSADYRSMLYWFGFRIQTAFDQLDLEITEGWSLGDRLFDEVGCWDFEVLPALLRRLIDQVIVYRGMVPVAVVKHHLRVLTGLIKEEAK